MAAWVSHSVFIGATWVTAIFGGIGIGAAFVSAIVGYHLTEDSLSAANQRIAESQAEAARANRAAEANQKAEQERLARVRLEARLADRTSLLDQAAITAGLAGLEKQRVSIIASPSTPESEMFARALGAPLGAAGWSVEVLPGTATATVLAPTGVIVQYSIDPRQANNFVLPRDESPAAARLVKLLSDQGIAASAVPTLVNQLNTLAIVVSSKM